MPYQLSYHPAVVSEDLPSLNRNIQHRIVKAIEGRLLVDPFHYGAPLQRDLKGYRKLRVGDYRVIYEVQGTLIKILSMGHRKEVYSFPVRSWPIRGAVR